MHREPITGDEYTARYVEAATKTLPIDQRDDYADELRSAIHDQIDDRIERGELAAIAEKSVLNGLGDPAVLAARYAARPLHLLSPRWYPTWRRLLRIILWSALPPIAFGVAVGSAVEGDSFVKTIFEVIGLTLTSAAWIFTLTTLVFVRLDRANLQAATWTVDALPANHSYSGKPPARSEWVVGIVAVFWAVIGMVVLSVSWDVPNVGRVSVLDPLLWPWSLILSIALIIAGAIVTARARMLGRWTTGAAIVNASISIVWAVLIISLLLNGHLFSPAFVQFIDIDVDAQRVLAICIVAGTLTLAGWSAVYGFRELRGRRAART